jgi:hypothetical protein
MQLGATLTWLAPADAVGLYRIDVPVDSTGVASVAEQLPLPVEQPVLAVQPAMAVQPPQAVQPALTVQPAMAVQPTLAEAALPVEPVASVVSEAGGVIGRKQSRSVHAEPMW